MPKTSDIKVEEAMMALFTGHPGAAKTCAAASYPGPIYFFDLDGRVAPIKKMFPLRDDIEYDSYFGNYDAMVRKMRAFEDSLYAWREDSEIPVKTIVIDSLTNLADAVIRYSKDLRGADTKSKAKMSRGLIEIADISDYNYETAALGDVVSFMKTMNEDYKINVIMTAHILRFEEADPGKGVGAKRVSWSLLTAGKKVAAKIPTVFNEMYYFEREGGWGEGSKAFCYTDTMGEYPAKSALSLPFKLDFTNKSFYEVLSEHIKEDK